jgi:hypothetical protein
MKKKDLLHEIELLKNSLQNSRIENLGLQNKIKAEKIKSVVETLNTLGQTNHEFKIDFESSCMGNRSIETHTFTLTI